MTSLAEMHGPSWYVSDEHPARLEACASATRNAKAKAQAYAAAVGLGLGALTLIREQGLTVQPSQPMVALPRTANGGQRGPELKLEPGAEQVTASVEVVFDMHPV
jgi:uncharacterized protein YggE